MREKDKRMQLSNQFSSLSFLPLFLQLQRLLKKTVGDLLESYKSTEAFESISEFAVRFKLDKVASQLSSLHLQENSISRQYSEEVVEVATRVNYGSNLDEIHALGALVTMAANDAVQIQDGNFQIFEGMVARSKAQVRMNTKIARVRRVEPTVEGGEVKFEVISVTGHSEIFDTIVIAAPIVRKRISCVFFFFLLVSRITKRIPLPFSLAPLPFLLSSSSSFVAAVNFSM